MQLGHLTTPARVVRGDADYGFVLNVTAIQGFQPEARITIEYKPTKVTLTDGATIELREPHYSVDRLSGPPLSANTVLMPRMPPPVQGAGSLERVPVAELEQVARLEREGKNPVRGQIAWLDNDSGNVPRTSTAGARGVEPTHILGRFGWQASEPSVASQVAVAFAREMGLTNPLEAHDDCAPSNAACATASSGGSPEVEPDLFEAVVSFQRWLAVPVMQYPDLKSAGGQLFESTGCAQCHRTTLRIDANTVIHPFTDLLLHNMGPGLADRTIGNGIAPSAWRTAPLWGMHAAAVSGQPQRFLHDGRARSIDEAVLWHDADGRAARDRFAQLPASQRSALTEWVNSL